MGARKGQQRVRYLPHLPEKAVRDGLDSGVYLQGLLKVNQKNRASAYVQVQGFDLDVLIDGAQDQNRAVHGDTVAIALHPVAAWKSLVATEEGAEVDAGRNGDRDAAARAARGHTYVPRNGTTISSLLESLQLGDGDATEPSRAKGRAKRGKGRRWDRAEASPLAAVSDRLVELDADMVDEARGADQAGSSDLRPRARVVRILKPSLLRQRGILCVADLRSAVEPQGSRSYEKAGEANGDEEEEERESSGRKMPANRRVTFKPLDPRFPYITSFVDELPAEGKCVLLRITKWDEFYFLPHGLIIAQPLGCVSDFPTQRDAILFQTGLHDTHGADFPKNICASLPKSKELHVKRKELAKRRDLRGWRIFTIDPPTARDLDDALSIEATGQGTVRVGVHIADVSHFVKRKTPVDAEAQSRATSVYLADCVVPMLPRRLCEDLCSLNPHAERLAFSIVWEMSLEDARITSQWIGKSVIKSCAKLHYDHAQAFIEGSSQDPDVEISNGFNMKQVRQDVLLLDRLAKTLRRRLDREGLTLDRPKLSMELGPDRVPLGPCLHERRDANTLVEEFMLLANRRVAEFLASRVPSAALLRRHAAPQAQKLEKLREELASSHSAHGFRLARSGDSHALHACMQRFREEAEPRWFDVANVLLSKTMQNAEYFCTGECEEHTWRHYALGFDRYTHFTSPIRRYPDLVVHRLVVDALQRAELENADGSGGKGRAWESTGSAQPSPWGPDFTCDVAQICEHCNEQKLAAKNAQEASNKLYFARWLELSGGEGGGVATDAVVLNVRGPKWFMVYVPQFGLEETVWVEDDASLTAAYDKGTQSLRLTPKGGGAGEVVLRGMDVVSVKLLASRERKHSQMLKVRVVLNLF